MKPYTKNYLNAFYPYWGADDFFPCEICKVIYGIDKRLADVHHIEPKGMGGSKEKDNIENLIGVCRSHHEYCHGERSPQISKDEQKRIHRAFTKRMQGNA